MTSTPSAMSVMMTDRPLNQRAYGSIPHLPGSRTGPSDRHISEGQAALCTIKRRDRRDEIIVQEKLDGSCVAIAKLETGEVVALGRGGELASASPGLVRRSFAAWAQLQQARFSALLRPGERIIGEWLFIAHGTRYALPHEPFVVFDLIRDGARVSYDELLKRAASAALTTPRLLHRGDAVSVDEILAKLDADQQQHGALDLCEGAVWRLERTAKAAHTPPTVEFLAKHVRHQKQDACYLPEQTQEDWRFNTWPSDAGPTPQQLLEACQEVRYWDGPR